jgi:hypothetical protein
MLPGVTLLRFRIPAVKARIEGFVAVLNGLFLWPATASHYQQPAATPTRSPVQRQSKGGKVKGQGY